MNTTRLFAAIRITPRVHFHIRNVSSPVKAPLPRQRGAPQPESDEDFRPRWVYIASRLMSFTLIPSAVLYSVFVYDFGDREHVFQPVRRWAAERKAAFMTLSPEDERLLASVKTSPGVAGVDSGSESGWRRKD